MSPRYFRRALCAAHPSARIRVLTRSSQFSNAPGPHTFQFFLDLPQFRQDPLGGFFRAALTYGDVVRYRGLWVTHQLSHPDHIQHVLQGNVANYRKGRGYRILKLSLGEGLLTSEGPLWQRITSKDGFTATSHYFVMDLAAVWKDIAVGLLIAGALGGHPRGSNGVARILAGEVEQLGWAPFAGRGEYAHDACANEEVVS